MALILSLIRFVCCLIVVEAFPNARRGEDVGYVVYTLPERCVPVPASNNVCNLDQQITSYVRDSYQYIVQYLKSSFKVYEQSFRGIPQCVAAIKRLHCQIQFPACLKGGRLDYGNKHEVFNDVKTLCTTAVEPLLTSFKDTQSGIHKDKHASLYSLNCKSIRQDPRKLCPKPVYKVPSSYASAYYEQVHNVSADMAKRKDKIPEECHELVLNTFACTYPFCSLDQQSALLKTTKQQCRSVRECFETHGRLDDDIKNLLKDACKGYPDENGTKKAALPAV